MLMLLCLFRYAAHPWVDWTQFLCEHPKMPLPMFFRPCRILLHMWTKTTTQRTVFVKLQCQHASAR